MGIERVSQALTSFWAVDILRKCVSGRNLAENRGRQTLCHTEILPDETSPVYRRDCSSGEFERLCKG